MKIGFDIQPFEGPDATRGIGRYTFNLLKAILAHPKRPNITLLGRAKTPPALILPFIKDQSCTYTPLPLEYPAEDYLSHSPLAPFDSDEFTRFDIIHITSPLMPDTLIPCWAPCTIVATLYDLIPLVLKEDSNISIFPEHVWGQYLKRVKTITSYDKVLCISNKTAEDLKQRLQIPQKQIEIIGTGVDEIFYSQLNAKKVRQIISKWGLSPGDYVFTIGGFNPRKNMDSHFLAFARLLELNPVKKLKLVVTCRLNYNEKLTWQKKLKELGIEKYVVLTNEVSDRELQALYQGAAVFLFLSLYEGFGLPVAEACVCSIPVVASAIPTNIEILGKDYPYLVDPYDVEQSANYLKEIIESSPSPEISEVFAKVKERFQWDVVAERCLEIYNRISSAPSILETSTRFSASKSPKVAIVSPLHSIRSGVADYVRELLPHLNNEAEVLLFADEPFPACTSIVPTNTPVNSSDLYPARLLHRFVKSKNIDIINYHIGNNITHSYAYFNLRYFPGIVTLHDLIIAPFIFEISRDISPLIIRKELEALYDEATARALFQEFLSNWHLEFTTPLLQRIKKNALGIIVHNNWTKQKLQSIFANNSPEIFVVPMGIEIPPDLDTEKRRQLREKLGLGSRTFVLISFGNITPNRRLDKAIEAFAWFHRIHPDSVFIIIGNFIEAHHKEYIFNTARFYNVGKSVHFTGYLEKDRFYEYLGVADLSINLRYPTFGETSASLLRALAMGIPALVSDTNQYKEYPDFCTFKIPPESPYEVDLIIDYLRFFSEHPEARQIVAEQARQYILQNHTLSATASNYIAIYKSLLNK